MNEYNKKEIHWYTEQTSSYQWGKGRSKGQEKKRRLRSKQLLGIKWKRYKEVMYNTGNIITSIFYNNFIINKFIIILFIKIQRVSML